MGKCNNIHVLEYPPLYNRPHALESTVSHRRCTSTLESTAEAAIPGTVFGTGLRCPIFLHLKSVKSKKHHEAVYHNQVRPPAAPEVLYRTRMLQFYTFVLLRKSAKLVRARETCAARKCTFRTNSYVNLRKPAFKTS